MNTIEFEEKPDGTFYTLAELNALFESIKTVLDGKIDVRGTTLLGDLILLDGSIINVPEAVEAGDIVGINGDPIPPPEDEDA